MSDIVFDNMVFDRLREISDQKERITALEAEIDRLRLTDEEREAVAWAIAFISSRVSPDCVTPVGRLRGLLERCSK